MNCCKVVLHFLETLTRLWWWLLCLNDLCLLNKLRSLTWHCTEPLCLTLSVEQYHAQLGMFLGCASLQKHQQCGEWIIPFVFGFERKGWEANNQNSCILLVQLDSVPILNHSRVDFLLRRLNKIDGQVCLSFMLANTYCRLCLLSWLYGLIGKQIFPLYLDEGSVECAKVTEFTGMHNFLFVLMNLYDLK